MVLQDELKALQLRENEFLTADKDLNELIENKTEFMVNRSKVELQLSRYQRAAITVEGVLGFGQPPPGETRGPGRTGLPFSLELKDILLIVVGLLVAFGLSFKTTPASTSITHPNGTIVVNTTSTSLIPSSWTLALVAFSFGLLIVPYIFPYMRKEPERGPGARWVTESISRVRQKYLLAYMLSKSQPQDPHALAYYRKVFPDFFLDRKRFFEETLPQELQDEIGKITNYVRSQIWACRAFLIDRLSQSRQPMGMFPQGAPGS
jgi:hypothetical protein